MLNTVDFKYFLDELKKGEIMDETSFYFVDEIGEPEHYIGCLMKFEKPYWVGLCDIPGGTEFLTAEELVNAKIYRGKSLKERWDDVRIICMGGISLEEWSFIEHGACCTKDKDTHDMECRCVHSDG